jgi:hypothetical protein
VPDHPSIPPIDPAFIAEVEQLTAEAYEARRRVVDLSSRVGRVMEQYDELTAGLSEDDEVDQVRDATNYPGLLNAMFDLAGHAAAAADHPADLPVPSWYRALREKRHARPEAAA